MLYPKQPNLTANTCNQLFHLNTLTDLRLGSKNHSFHLCKPFGLNLSFQKMILYISNFGKLHQEIAKPFPIRHFLSYTKPSLTVSPNPPLHSTLPMLHCRRNIIPGFASFQAAQHPSNSCSPTQLTSLPHPVLFPAHQYPAARHPQPINNLRLFIWHLCLLWF